VSGGVDFERFDSTDPVTTMPGIITGIGPTGTFAGFLGAARNMGGVIGQERSMRMDLQVICTRPGAVANYDLWVTDFANHGGVTGGLIACKNDQWSAVSGGGYWHAAGDISNPDLDGQLVGTVPRPSGWYTAGDGGDTGHRFVAYAICLPN
jgi:hypothetical protein